MNVLRCLLLQHGVDFSVFRESSGGFLGIDLLSVDENLKTTVVERDECELTKALLILIQ